MAALTDHLAHWAAECPDRTFVVDAPGGVECSFREMASRVVSLGASLPDLRVGPGDRVALVAENSLEWVVAFLATMAAGAVIVPMNTRLAAPEVLTLLDDCRPTLTLVDAAQMRKFHNHPTHQFVCLEELPRRVADCVRLPDIDRIDPSDLACITYTSGTTGRPKGVMLSHRSLATSAGTFAAIFESSAELRTAVAVPLFHNTGFVDCLAHALVAGGQLDVYRRFDPLRIGRSLFDGAYNYFIGVPSMYGRMLDALAGSRVSEQPAWLAYGGAPMPDSLPPRIAGVFSRARLVNVYGLSEATSITHYLPWSAAAGRWNSIGFAAPGTVDRISASGELEVDSPTAMLGYWQDREATAAKLRERWLRTGDLVQRDADGAVTVLGRIDDVINRGGEKVMPSEVESVLVSYPAVLDAGVVGLEDDDLGEIPVAAVVARLGATVDRADLDRFVAARLADFKRPVLISVISALPRNANGKLERAELRRLMTSRARSGQPAATSPS